MKLAFPNNGKITAAIIAMVMGLLLSTSAKGAPASTLPKELKASWRSLAANAPISSVTVDWDGQTLTYQLTRPVGAKRQASDRISIRPSEKAWQEFWQSMEAESVWKWLPDYRGRPEAVKNRATKSRAWSIAIEWGGKKVRAGGTNGYPSLRDVSESTEADPMFNRFWHALDRLLGRPIEVEGRYFAAFEASQFRPSTQEYKGQVWWLYSNKDFNERYQKLSPKEETGFRFGGPEVTARLRGRLVGPGHYGHLNSYEYEFLVEEVLEMKVAP